MGGLHGEDTRCPRGLCAHAEWRGASPDRARLLWNGAGGRDKNFNVQPAPEITASLANAKVRAALDLQHPGPGAADLLGEVTLNIGVVKGGLKLNMIPSECRIEADIRVLVGLSKAEVLDCINSILRDFPQVTMVEESIAEETHANWCDPEGEMLHLIQHHAEQVCGIKPVPIATLALTDARWWRNASIAYIYGLRARWYGESHDERVRLEEFLNVIRDSRALRLQHTWEGRDGCFGTGAAGAPEGE